MKKLIAITLLLIHLFNITGYTFIFHYRMDKTDRQINKRIDANNYNDNDLLQVKVPLNMPYITNTAFERVDGKVEYKGVHYNYVKRKVYNDTVYLLCLPNKEKTQLAVAKINFTKAVNDIPSNKKEAGSFAKKGGLTWEYNTVSSLFKFDNNFVAEQQKNIFITSRLSPVFISSPAQPPDFSC